MSTQIRTLEANEIDVRAAQVNKNGATLVIYKNTRTDMDILDETYGKEYWQREHQLIGDKLYCTIKVWNRELKQWIAKQDVGDEGYSGKGQASDSFKRAGFNIGIGRELYTAPKIWVGSDKINLKDTGRKDKYNNPVYTTYDKFTVKEIDYNDNREISKLVIVNQDNKTVFTYEKNDPISKTTINKINFLADCYAKELGNKTTDQIIAETKKRFNFNKIEDLTDSQGLIVVEKLNEWIEMFKKKNKTA